MQECCDVTSGRPRRVVFERASRFVSTSRLYLSEEGLSLPVRCQPEWCLPIRPVREQRVPVQRRPDVRRVALQLECPAFE